MILRLVFGRSVACDGFANTGESMASRGLTDPSSSFCKGVAERGVEKDHGALSIAESIVDVVGEGCIILASEDRLGDSGFEGWASITKSSVKICDKV